MTRVTSVSPVPLANRTPSATWPGLLPINAQIALAAVLELCARWRISLAHLAGQDREAFASIPGPRRLNR
ncbi:MAG: hypothetical protein ACI9ZM_001710, partial [Paracoccaceae bacterium]